LERKDNQNNDDWMIFALENIAKRSAFEKEGRNPTLDELLYNQTEDEMLTINELLENE